MSNGSGIKKQKVGVMGVVFMIYAMACAGAYGIEDMIPLAGPGMTILMLCTIPFLWAIPNAMASAEMGSAIPEEGGNYVWVKRAFGEFWCFQSVWSRILSIYLGVPIYIVLAADYVGTLCGWSDTTITIFKLALIALFSFINWLGVSEVARVSTILGFLIVAAFVFVAIAGFSHAQYNPVDPFIPEGQGVLYSAGSALAIGMWMFTGYESMANVAGELENPQVIPKALLIVVPMILCTYIPTTLAGLASMGHWEDWGTAGISYGAVASLVSPIFGVIFVLVAFIGQCSIYNSWLIVGPRYFLVLAEDNYCPKFLTKTNKNGVPIGGWVLMIIASVILTSFSFSALATLTVATILFPTSIMMIGAIKLRYSEPDLKRPYKVNLGNKAFAVLCMLVPITAFIALFLNGTDYFVGGVAIIMFGPILYYILRRSLGGFTKNDPEKYPENPKTKLPFGDFKRISFLYLMFAILSFVGYFFLPWYDDPSWYAELYGSESVFGGLITAILCLAITSTVICIVTYLIYRKYDNKEIENEFTKKHIIS